ncbi:MAG: hypothetical protein J5493_03800 [Lachnospiraceae bacterium]|nr:hypothetical protein [Lachnospiraceae bacterium]
MNNLRNAKIIVLAGCAVMWVFIILGLITNLEIFAEIGVGVAIGTGLVWFLRWRCPHCGKFIRKAATDVCPACGKELDWKLFKK